MAVGKGSLDRVAKASAAAPKADFDLDKPVAVEREVTPKVKKAETRAEHKPSNETYGVGDKLPVHLL